MTEVTDSEYYYNVSQFGEHNISVAAVIGDELEGKINTIIVEVPEGKSALFSMLAKFQLLLFPL